MKKKLILSLFALIATIGIASAQNTQTKSQTQTTQTRRTCFVDANNNGVCDSYENGTCKVGNGKGLQDGSGRGQGLRNGSGRRGGGNQAIGQGRGRGGNAGQGLRNGSGRGNGGRAANFVDANNNGICDRRETTTK
ncbi:MAG: DUF6520 family protein [Bacteroidales bacterium]|jgi:hypothetical protein|uniref:DUF6520 family protein n=1 Tax=Parabacteroides sp. HGS0025 TaxID=1078087 RepID=UPI0006174471|nr:DUF6520 family protein [Parabacteroides sp. HGS0025]KKB45243.1 hypothetical protein HMPREF1212_05198 [Parabacteroides sp. HGS0025]MDD2292704.1 DUF6520 family protein [Bacteroidales bacterium]MDD3200446.1 DUF6520 family protein [Bacteroidales bacterium]